VDCDSVVAVFGIVVGSWVGKFSRRGCKDSVVAVIEHPGTLNSYVGLWVVIKVIFQFLGRFDHNNWGWVTVANWVTFGRVGWENHAIPTFNGSHLLDYF